MLVTFRSEAWSNVTLFGNVAVELLKMAGHSGTIPGALQAQDIPSAIERLNQGLAATAAVDLSGPPLPGAAEDADHEPAVGLRLRAHPLLQLLSAAARQGRDVMWDQGAPLA